MDKNKVFQDDETFIANTYARNKILIESGKGATLYDSDGKAYIDCASGIGVNIFGAQDDEWKKAVLAQMDKIAHVCNLYYTEPQAKLAKLLCEKTGAKKVFFCNSGAEANECAIKTARKYGNEKLGGSEIITLKRSFHGRTMATLTATGQEEFHKHFSPFLDGFKYADPTPDGILSCYTDKTCAVMIETIQGEGGVVSFPSDFLIWADKFCKSHNLLLICDEVQTGNGRTGYLYSYMKDGLRPDIVTTAKGLGGGLPIGACIMFDKCKDVLSKGDHGSTFGGNPIACAGAYNIISRLTDDFLMEVRGKAAYFRANLSHIKGVLDLSGEGLMIGLKCEKQPAQIVKDALEKGLICLTAHDRLRLLPPLTISKEQMNEACKILNEVIGK